VGTHGCCACSSATRSKLPGSSRAIRSKRFPSRCVSRASRPRGGRAWLFA
jgi:hypothetical protein